MMRYGLESPVGMGLMVGVVVLEGVKPGWVLVNLGHLANRLIKALRQPIQWQWQPSNRSSILLVVSLIALIGILWQQGRSGLLTWEAGRFTLRLMGIFLVLPGLIGIGVIRASVFQRWEDRLK